jgi:predicted negative regulator of RcsB-dependent stress response
MRARGLHTPKVARRRCSATRSPARFAANVTWRQARGAPSVSCATIGVSNSCRRALVSEHISRKELKHDKVRETFEHGAEAVLSHTRIASIAMVIIIVIAAGYLGWKFYSDRQNNQAQAQLDDAMRIFNAPLAVPGQPALPGEVTYSDSAKRETDAQVKFAAVANKFPSTKPGKVGRYYSALCLMDLDKLNQASEELNRLDAGSDKELSALAQYQKALIAERSGKKDDAVRLLRALSTTGSVLVPKPLVLLELAGLLRTSDPKEATNIYEQLKKEYPNSAIVDEADRGLQSVSPKS